MAIINTFGVLGITSITSADGTVQFFGNGGIVMPNGTSGQRPGSPRNGTIRLNTDLNIPEWYSTSTNSWQPFTYNRIPVEYLVIAGGGGGGAGDNGGPSGGGGGAGGYRTNVPGQTSGRNAAAESSYFVSVGTALNVTVGGGGGNNTAGSPSTFDNITSTGGGRGGNLGQSGGSGGSGGGGGGGGGGQPGGAGTTDQGFQGGNWGGSGNEAGGGGGASSAGISNTVAGPATGQGGEGGTGLFSNITGTSIQRAGGGGGGKNNNVNNAGPGGGGYGGTSPQSGTTNTGGGGGGRGYVSAGGAGGGSGLVVLRVPPGVTASFSAGLTATSSTLTSSFSQTYAGYTVYTVTAGTGTVTFNLG